MDWLVPAGGGRGGPARRTSTPSAIASSTAGSASRQSVRIDDGGAGGHRVLLRHGAPPQPAQRQGLPRRPRAARRRRAPGRGLRHRPSTRRCRRPRTSTASRTFSMSATASGATGSTGPRTATCRGGSSALLGRRPDDQELRAHHLPSRQRLLGGGHPGRPVHGHLDGLHAPRGARDGQPQRRPRSRRSSRTSCARRSWGPGRSARSSTSTAACSGCRGSATTCARCSRRRAKAATARAWPWTCSATASRSTSRPTWACSGGVDGLAFAGGIGENAPDVRAPGPSRGWRRWASRSTRRRTTARAARKRRSRRAGARARVFVIPTNEEILIARDTLHIVSGRPPS